MNAEDAPVTNRGPARLDRPARPYRKAIAAIASALLLASAPGWTNGTDESAAGPRVLRVGSLRALTSVAEASRLARDGDSVEIDAGDYPGDVASWPQSHLTIRAVGGRARIIATDAIAEGKALMVVKGDQVVVEHLEFSGARSPHQNGAGIRHEGGRLTVRDCLFERNEMGILTWNNAAAELIVESSEFRDNAVAPEYEREGSIGHQLYVGTIRSFTLRDSYVHRGAVGHLVKSRARENRIFYNRITDEAGGTSSYELDFPNGGIAYVLGNLIEQSARTENAVMVAFGAEGYKWPRAELYLSHNTLVDHHQGGHFLRVWPGADRLLAVNNLLVGPGTMTHAGTGTYARNLHARASDFRSAAAYDYRLHAKARQAGKAVDPGVANGVRLRPEREYAQPLRSRPVPKGPYSPGAVQSLAR